VVVSLGHGLAPAIRSRTPSDLGHRLVADDANDADPRTTLSGRLSRRQLPTTDRVTSWSRRRDSFRHVISRSACRHQEAPTPVRVTREARWKALEFIAS
jgi:hypothetical protein